MAAIDSPKRCQSGQQVARPAGFTVPCSLFVQAVEACCGTEIVGDHEYASDCCAGIDSRAPGGKVAMETMTSGLSGTTMGWPVTVVWVRATGVT